MIRPDCKRLWSAVDIFYEEKRKRSRASNSVGLSLILESVSRIASTIAICKLGIVGYARISRELRACQINFFSIREIFVFGGTCNFAFLQLIWLVRLFPVYIIVFHLPPRSRPSPTVTSTPLATITFYFLISTQMRAGGSVLFCFMTDCLPNNPNFSFLRIILILYSYCFPLFSFSILRLSNTSESEKPGILFAAPTPRCYTSRDNQYRFSYH